MKEETAQKAARWWASYLRGTAPLDHGDSSQRGGMVVALATILQQTEKQSQTDEQINAFEQELAQLLVAQDGYVYIGVDYHPDYTLTEAATKAGLNLGMTTLPWKTSMWIDEDTIRVSCGYGAASKQI